MSARRASSYILLIGEYTVSALPGVSRRTDGNAPSVYARSRVKSKTKAPQASATTLTERVDLQHLPALTGLLLTELLGHADIEVEAADADA
jgi:hypothetical protein